MIKTPFYKQKKDYTCGPAVLKMVFGFFGIRVKESELAKLGKTNHTNGTNHEGLIYTIRKKGFYCYVHEHASINQIKHFLDLKLPVIVNYIEPKDEEGHYAVVVGHNSNHLILNDPYNGPKFKLTIEDFEKRWRGKHTNHNSKHWLLVISKNPFSIGKQFEPY